MDRLSSCYFCGAAFDATLDEQPVVPSSLHPSADDQKTVVLCRTCQRKLDVVLDTVIDAVDSDASSVATETTGEAAEAATAANDLESTLGDDEDILSPLGEDDDSDPQDPVEAAEASGMEFGDDRARKQGDEEAGSDGEADADQGTGKNVEADEDDETDGQKKPKYTKSRGAGFRKEDDGPSETGSLTGGAFEDKDDDSGRSRRSGRSSASSDSGGAGGSAESTSDSGSSGGSASSDESDGSASTTPSTDASDTGDDGADENRPSRNVTMSRLENTKVMRLLENREFPVDKDEFVTVAANAYQISRGDCEKVIDLAIEHGLLREEQGQLYGRDS